MPRLWTETIEGHRREVRGAIIDTAAALVAEHGLLAVTMSRIAEEAGIGRATLYKYFPDVGSILLVWHERQIAGHLRQLAEIRKQPGTAGERLAAVLEAYARIRNESRRHHDADLGAFLHRHERITRAEEELRRLIRDLIAEAAASGEVRKDVAPDELASYCLHALSAADRAASRAGLRRLVSVILAGLRPSG
jgi:AcrR family transcriptional regulator